MLIFEMVLIFIKEFYLRHRLHFILLLKKGGVYAVEGEFSNG